MATSFGHTLFVVAATAALVQSWNDNRFGLRDHTDTAWAAMREGAGLSVAVLQEQTNKILSHPEFKSALHRLADTPTPWVRSQPLPPTGVNPGP